MRVLVSGATGYIGGRLVPELLDAGHTVRAMTRSDGWLRDVPWSDRVEVVTADALRPESLPDAMREVDVAYFLIHSIGTGSRFAAQDRVAATNFAAAACEAGVRRIVYLGGLADESDERISEHLASRAEVGRILSESGVPTIALRAAVILGSGSASFEMLRYLTERLPAMITPSWVDTRIQPIAVRDVLRYLMAALDLPDGLNRSFDIGGPDVLTYRQMMHRYAAVAGLRPRLIVGVPVLSPRLSSYWVGLITPVPAALARPLVESLRTEVVCREHDIESYVPAPADGLTGFDRSVELALQRIREATVTTRWSENEWPGAPSDPLPSDPDWAGGSLYTDLRSRAGAPPAERPRPGGGQDGLTGFDRSVELALQRIREATVTTRWSENEWPGAPSDPLPSDPDWAGGSLYTDLRSRPVPAPAERTWQVVESIGGEQGWYSFPLAWAVRGLLDRAVGGVGLRRGRRDPHRLRVGDALDFWRVEELQRGRLLRLRAEMRLPGLAWLEFRVDGSDEGCTLTQKATFYPRGLAGHLYWHSISPFHGIVFGGMIRNIAAAAALPAPERTS